MTILGIETSCDETSASLVKSENNKLKLLSNVVSSSVLLHAKTGGIVPENAAREQLKYIIPVIKESLVADFDKIAVTYGPGLMGSLLIGVETAKTLSYVFEKPIIPVNHLIGHIYANWIEQDKNIEFPALSLLVSGGHTDLVLIKNHGNIKWLGGTRDDAAGEALDKTGRLMDLPYPAGPTIEKLAKEGNPKAFSFPRPMIDSNDFDFSFSGLKAAVLRETQKDAKIKIGDLCASVQEAIVDVLIFKTIKAAKKYKVKSILLGGGVAANQRLRDELKNESDKLGIEFFVPPKNLCTDNGAMIAAAAFFNNGPIPFNKISANPQLYFA
ncbi:MAG TPA: tRNA (adenosine(37)-N6)-threonylcarbamoyltransferase complex transferase subunit TsaD [Patescibacteria group bacterium]|nr:tRNA (adenosine(37)-N6)-threonylcarbamoyltransferase complex transferase subunit TsaD [Patescibacteria group bacterium]